MAFIFFTPSSPGVHLLPLLLLCLDRHLLRLILAARDADPPRAPLFTDGKLNREDPILVARLDSVDIDRLVEGDRPFKCAGGDFLQDPDVSTRMAVCRALLRLLSSVVPLRLLLALHLVLTLVLSTVATSNRQGVLINCQFNIFRPHPWERNIHLIAIRRLTNVHRCHLSCCARHHTGIHKALFKQLIHRTAKAECLAERIVTSNHRSVPPGLCYSLSSDSSWHPSPS